MGWIKEIYNWITKKKTYILNLKVGAFIIMRNKRNLYNENNVTKYDEFVCSEFVWLPINKQKENAKRMEEMTRMDDDDER